MDIAAFRAAFPEFSEAVAPDAQVNFWAALAVVQMDAAKWGDLYDSGVQLYTAHNLALSLRNGSTPGAAVAGAVTGKSVGGVSVSYASTVSAAFNDAGHWSTTTYGQQWWMLRGLAGAGAVQL